MVDLVPCEDLIGIGNVPPVLILYGPLFTNKFELPIDRGVLSVGFSQISIDPDVDVLRGDNGAVQVFIMVEEDIREEGFREINALEYPLIEYDDVEGRVVEYTVPPFTCIESHAPELGVRDVDVMQLTILKLDMPKFCSRKAKVHEIRSIQDGPGNVKFPGITLLKPGC